MPLTLRLTKGTELTHQELDDNFTYLEGLTTGSTGSTDYISNITLSNDFLVVTGTGSAFSGSIDLSDINTDTRDYVSNVTFANGTLSFTGQGSAFASTVDISGVNTDTRDYISSISFANNTLSFTGVGAAADATIDLGSLAGGGIALTDLSVTTATASGGGSLSYENTTGAFTFTPADLSSAGGGIALTDLSVTTTTASSSGSLAYNSGSGVFTFSPVAHQSYALLTTNGSSTGSIAPSNQEDILYFKGGTNVTITAGTESGTGDFSALTLDTLTFDVDLSSVSGSAGSEVGHTYLQTAGQSQPVPFDTDPGPTPIIWAGVDNGNASASFEFGNTANIGNTNVSSTGVFTVNTGTFLRVSISSFITVSSNNTTITYSFQTSQTGQNTWSTVKTVQRTKSATGTFADSFWSIFKVDGSTDIRIVVSSSTANAIVINPGTQLEIIELS